MHGMPPLLSAIAALSTTPLAAPAHSLPRSCFFLCPRLTQKPSMLCAAYCQSVGTPACPCCCACCVWGRHHIQLRGCPTTSARACCPWGGPSCWRCCSARACCVGAGRPCWSWVPCRTWCEQCMRPCAACCTCSAAQELQLQARLSPQGQMLVVVMQPARQLLRPCPPPRLGQPWTLVA